MKPLRSLEAFHDLTVSMSTNPVLGVVIGTLFTVLVQSSSATIGILQGLFSDGLIDINGAPPVLFGDNIGTTITAVLASLGASVALRRAAATHVLFNLIGTAIFLILLKPFTALILSLQTSMGLDPKMTIAFAHGIFNTTNTIIQLPFVGLLALIVTKLIPGKDSMVEYKSHLDPIFIEQSPSIALGQAKEEVLQMGNFAVQGLEVTKQFLVTKQTKYAANAYQIEDAVNNLDRKITDYLIELSSSSLSEHESEEHHMLMDTVRDIERIGDHFENVIELIEYQQAHRVVITESAMADLTEMMDLTISTVKASMEALHHNDVKIAEQVIEKEDDIDKMERKLRKSILSV